MRARGLPRRLVLVIALLLIAAWGAFFVLVLPGDYVAGTTPFGIGLAVTTFVLGMRHAFDADHIAAIDNTTRKLIGENRDASSVGMWFAFGHSTVVIAAVGSLTAGMTVLTSQWRSGSSPLMSVAGVWGPAVSSAFLFVIGSVNLVALLRALRPGSRPAPLPGGPVSRVLRRTGGTLDRPWKMFVVGLLFGLGFDTASTVGLLLVAGGVGIMVPWYIGMVLPLLFTAGMVACDGINGMLMARAYRWSLGVPDRRLSYNLVLMGVSVLIAFFIGTVGLSGILVDDLNVALPPLEVLADTSFDGFGFIVVATLLLLWAMCLGLYRIGRRRSLH